jgi:hypothetical protein
MIQKELYSWIIILQEASETVYIVSMGMNTSSRSTPTSLMHIISFTSRFDKAVVLEFCPAKYHNSMTCENFRVLTD